MKEVRVEASRSYSVYVQPGLIDSAGEYISSLIKGDTAVIVSDDNVSRLYGQRLRLSLEKSGFRVLEYVFPHGEKSKCMDVYIRLLEFLLENRLTRSDVIVALGGGVVGDLAGFAAATFQRGMGLIQIPTTLLAMVDSSVGGKTAVNLEHGKNQVGSFYQPYGVICDPETLDTLPEEEFLCGCAEVIKYAVLGSREFFDSLKGAGVRQNLEGVITACVEMKRDIVASDEFDTGRRMLLNLGHTVGHAVEACSGFTVLHGQAVAIGMAVISRAANRRGLLPDSDLHEILDILERFGLPTQTKYPALDLYRETLADKKSGSTHITLVVPRKIGSCELMKPEREEVLGWIEDGIKQ